MSTYDTIKVIVNPIPRNDQPGDLNITFKCDASVQDKCENRELLQFISKIANPRKE